MSGETSLLLRSESVLVFWQDGLAMFRVRLSRTDGAVAEAHGAAHDGEAEQFWTLAENRARSRAQELLDEMPVVQPGRLLPPSAPAGNPVGMAGGPRAAPPERPAAARMPAAPQTPAGPAAGSTAPPAGAATGSAANNGAVGGAETNGIREESRQPSGAIPAPTVDEDAAGSSSPVTTTASPSAYTPDDDPFSDEVQFADETAGEGETRPAARVGFTPPEGAEGRQPGHIRPEAGGAGRPVAPVRTAGPSGPASNAAEPLQCTVPGCSTTLTPGQVTLSTHKFGQALCPRHMKERSGGS